MFTLKRILSRQSPLTLLFVTASAIFTVEIAIMFLLHLIHLMSPLAEALLDAALLVAVLFPVLYLFLFRLMARRIVEREQAEAALQQANQELESKVAARTRELNNAVEQLSHELKQRKRAESRLAKLNECLLSFGSDPNENINRLVAFCGEQLQATCALYNRLEGDTLYSLGQWNTPPDYNPVDKPDGHICYDVIRGGGNDACVIRDLLQTSYAQTDPNVVRYGLQTYVGKAVSFGGAFVGSLCVVYQEDRTPSEDDLNLLGIAASAVGVEEKRKQAEQEIQQRAAEMSALQETALDLVSHLETKPLLETIIRRATDLLGVTGGVIYQWEEPAQQLRCTITHNLSRDYTNMTLRPGEGMAGRVYQTGQPLVVNDYAHWEGRAAHFRDIPSRAVISVPILWQNRVIGVINVNDESGARTFDDRDVRLLGLFANQAAIAIENAQLYAAVQQELAERKQAEEALRASEKRFRSLFEDSPISLWEEDFSLVATYLDELRQSGVTDFRAYLENHPEAVAHCATMVKVVDVNRGTLRLYKAKSKEEFLAGLNVVLSEEAIPTFREELIALAEGKARFEGEAINQTLTGDKIHVALSWSVAPGDDKGARRLFVSISDITGRKRAEEKLAAKVTELEQHNREIKLLNEMGDLLQSCQTVEETSTVVAQFAQKLFPNESGALCLIAPSRNFVEAIATWGESPPPERVFTPDDCWALRRGQVHSVVDPRSGLLCRHVSQSFGPSTLPRVAGQAFGQDAPLPPERQPKGGYLCAPMMAQGETLGILHLQSRQSGPSQTREELAAVMTSQQQLAATLAGHIALALANLKLREALRQQAIRDPLTGLFNRRYMEETLERELRRAERRQAPLGIIMFDLDHFKKFNDTFGHAAGDIVLREIGAFLQTHVRAEDIACRLGGEEFIVILPEASLEDTLKRAEQLREGVKQLQVRYHDQALGAVTVSLGVAVFPEHGSTAEATLQTADAALYRAKREGRDRVAVGTTTEE